MGTAGLELHWGGLSAGGGALFGDGLGSRGDRGGLRHARHRRLHAARASRRRRARSGSASRTRRGRAATSRSCASCGSSPTTRTSTAVTLVLRAEPADSFAHAEELADALRVLRAHHKKVLCSLEDAGARALYVCANADRTVVSPAGRRALRGAQGAVHLPQGPARQDRRQGGVRPHRAAQDRARAVHERARRARRRRGPRGPAPPARGGLREEPLALPAPRRGAHPRGDARAARSSPQEAKDAGFVDGFAFDDELEHATKELVGRDIALREVRGRDAGAVAPSARAASSPSSTSTGTSSTGARSTSRSST